MRVSRPKTVMNHGIPAAGSRPGPSPCPQPQGGQVRDRLVEGVAQHVPVRGQAGELHRPRLERGLDAASLRPEAQLDEIRGAYLSLERHDDVDPHVPCLVRSERDRESHEPVLAFAATREHDLGAPASAVALGEHDLAGLRVEIRVCAGRQAGRVERVAEREVVLLDADDVREVGAELDLHREGDRSPGLVAEDQVVLEPMADEPVPRDREDVLSEPTDERVARVEGGGEVLHLARGEKQRTVPVHRHGERREESRVVRVEAAGPVAQVAELVADAERRPLEDRERHAGATPPFSRPARRMTAREP